MVEIHESRQIFGRPERRENFAIFLLNIQEISIPIY
jgi:hypothetical protein